MASPSGARGRWQVKLAGQWKEFSDREHQVIQEAYDAGKPTVELRARGQTYTIDFTLNTQTNTKTPPYKVRPIRHPGVAAAGGGENAYPGGGFNHGRRSSTGSVDSPPPTKSYKSADQHDPAAGPSSSQIVLGVPVNRNSAPGGPTTAQPAPTVNFPPPGTAVPPPNPAVNINSPPPPGGTNKGKNKGSKHNPSSPQFSGSITVVVQTLTGKKIPVENLNPATTTVVNLKERIEAVERIAKSDQRLLCAGRQLEDEKLLNDYGVRDQGIVTLLLKLS
ncbi:unnamed protein product [Amoebophrya sp. A120]|nr:unnamed protein product [Amoebophrya sp. A120]|eukprot:GSA120T00013126001.1